MWRRALLVIGPGTVVMLSENDGPSMLSYATTGATYGIGFFVPFIALTFLLAFVVQESVLRIGVATRRGLADLIDQRFGPVWGTAVMLDLLFANVITLIAEFIAIAAGAAYFGLAPAVVVPASAMLIILASSFGASVTWERAALTFALVNVVFIPAAILAHPDPGALGRALATWQPIPKWGGTRFLTLILANVGASVTPWMLFFQQGAVSGKGIMPGDLRRGRIDTGIGAAAAAVIAVATTVAAAPLFDHHIGAAALSGGADFAEALRPYLGAVGAALFAIGMIEAGIVAALTISMSSAFVAAEVLQRRRRTSSRSVKARSFTFAGIGSITVAAAVVLIPHVPLLEITVAVNVLAALLMAPALVFVLILAGDRRLMGEFTNGPAANAVGRFIIAGIAVLGVAYAVVSVAQRLSPVR